MHKDDWYFFQTFQPPINWCEKGKKFTVFIMSARYYRKILVYILIHLIKMRGVPLSYGVYVFVRLNSLVKRDFLQVLCTCLPSF